MSILCGFFVSLLWMLLVHEEESKVIGLSRLLFGADSIAGHPWNMIDPQIVALPMSLVVFVAVSFFTTPVKVEVLRNAFRHI